jgi:transcriptional regulator with XRE-family HTH domain
MSEPNRAANDGCEGRLLEISLRPRRDAPEHLITHLFASRDEAADAMRAADALGLGVRITSEQQVSPEHELSLRWQVDVWSDAFRPHNDEASEPEHEQGARRDGEDVSLLANTALGPSWILDVARDRAERRRHFGNALAVALRTRGLTQTQLADVLDTTQSAVSAWITGRSEPAADTVFACEVATGVGPGALSCHLGYLPLDAAGAPPRIEDLVAGSGDLDDDGKHMVLTVWRTATRHARALRAMRATTLGDTSDAVDVDD